MPNWNQLLDEIRQSGSTFDLLRRKYLRRLHLLTKRNVIAYYSGWLQKPGLEGTEVNDYDKNGFMSAIHGLDRSKGLDLILHTPGGGTAATESMVDYLRSMFSTDIRAIVPQLALSAGTMIALACKQIVMGKQSSLGPIDPQFRGLPAHGVIEEFEQAYKEVVADQLKIPLWQPIISKYSPTLIGECQKAMKWAEEMVTEWLMSGMFAGKADATEKAVKVVKELTDHALTKSHARHLSAEAMRKKGLDLDIMDLEADDRLQDAVLSVHHMFMHTLSATPAFKIIENHKGIAFVLSAQQILLAPGKEMGLTPVSP
jgi:hypothetical protein